MMMYKEGYQNMLRTKTLLKTSVVTIFIVFGIIILGSLVFIQNNFLKGSISTGFSVVTGVGGIFVYFIAYPEKLQQWKAIIFGTVRKYDEKLDKSYVENDIEAVVNSLNEYNFGYELESGVDVVWEKSADRQSILEDGEVIICLDTGDNQSANLARATLQYAKTGIIPGARRHIPDPVNKGLNYCVTLNMLSRNEKDDAIRVLYEDIILPVIENSDGEVDESPVKTAYERSESLRKGGFLGPVLLNEFEKLTEHGMPSDDIRSETEEFLEFLETIAERGDDDTFPFTLKEIILTYALA